MELASYRLCGLAERRSYDLGVLHHLHALTVLIDAFLQFISTEERINGRIQGVLQYLLRVDLH